MKQMELVRVANIESGIFGVLKDEGVPFCVTVENNDYYFPDGLYKCRRVDSPKYGNTFEITDIAGRDHVLFHWGNWEDNSLGCVILGENFTVIKNKEAVGYSKMAFMEFINRTKDIDEFILDVRSV